MKNDFRCSYVKKIRVMVTEIVIIACFATEEQLHSSHTHTKRQMTITWYGPWKYLTSSCNI